MEDSLVHLESDLEGAKGRSKVTKARERVATHCRPSGDARGPCGGAVGTSSDVTPDVVRGDIQHRGVAVRVHSDILVCSSSGTVSYQARESI